MGLIRRFNKIAFTVLIVNFALVGCGEHFQAEVAREHGSPSTFGADSSAPAPETIEGLYISFLSESTTKFRHHSGDRVDLNAPLAQPGALGPTVHFKVDGFEANKARGLSLVNLFDGSEVQTGVCVAEKPNAPASCSLILGTAHFETYVCPNMGINRFYQPNAGTYEVRLHYVDSYKRSVIVFPDPCNPDPQISIQNQREVASVQESADETGRYVSWLMTASILVGLCLISFLLYRRTRNQP